jgi:hypothetical protein
MSDAWLRDFQRLEKLEDDVQADISERNRMMSMSVNTQKLTTSIRRKLNQLNTEIATLEHDLSRMSDDPHSYKMYVCAQRESGRTKHTEKKLIFEIEKKKKKKKKKHTK